MRQGLAAALLAVAAACATPQPPTAAPAPPVAQAAAPVEPAPPSDVTVANIGLLQVLVQRMPGAELVTASLAIRGGSQALDAKTAGVELLGLRTAAAGGTEQLDKEAFSKKLRKLGSTVTATAAPNYSTLEAKSLLSAWEATFDLLSGVFLHPGLPGAELELQRQQLLAELKQEQETPDGALGYLAFTTLFAGTPYANRPVGTEESVTALTAEQVRAHLASLRTQSRLLLVVVGDVEPEAVVARARAAFGGLPAGEPVPPLPQALAFSQPHLVADARRLPTNYVLALFAGPTWQSPDLPAGYLALSILANRQFLEVRTKRNLSYAAGASLRTSSAQSFGGLYVSAVDPSTALPVMQDVVKDLASHQVPDKELVGYRSTFLTGFLEGQATTDGAAARLVAAQLLGGDWRLAKTLPERVRHVTAWDVQGFAEKYIRNYQVAVVGDPAKVDLSMLR